MTTELGPEVQAALTDAWSAVHALRFQHRDHPSHDGDGIGGPDSFYNGVLHAQLAVQDVARKHGVEQPWVR